MLADGGPEATDVSGPQDDESIGNDELLWRRTAPMQWVMDADAGRIRPSSSAFDNRRDGPPMSVALASIAARGIDGLLEGHTGFGVVAFSAGFARQLHKGVLHAPLENQPEHAHVVGRKTECVKKQFAKGATVVLTPS